MFGLFAEQRRPSPNSPNYFLLAFPILDCLLCNICSFLLGRKWRHLTSCAARKIVTAFAEPGATLNKSYSRDQTACDVLRQVAPELSAQL
jgi:hypothetical protein